MPIISSLVLFIVLTATLQALRTRLIYELSGMSLLLVGSTRPGIYFYSIFFLPGTIIHELSHWIVAEILQVKTGTITILPDLEAENYPDSKRLGSVATVRTDPFRGFIIGAAPFFTGIGILMVLGRSISIVLAAGFIWWKLALIIYGIIVISNSMMISESDRRTWPFIIIFILLLSVWIYKYYPSLFLDHEAFYLGILRPINQILGVTAAINLVMIGGSYALRRVTQVITKKRLIYK